MGCGHATQILVCRLDYMLRKDLKACRASAGLRIDAEQMTRSRMSYYTSLALVSMLDDTIIPAPPEQQLPISGIAPGHWINFVTWSHDGATLAFTLRSAGVYQYTWLYLPFVRILFNLPPWA